jgi:transposase-like protein
MTNHDTTGAVSDKQVIAIEAIVSGSTVTEAAERAGVSRQTVHHWQAQPAFVAALNLRRAERDRAASESLLDLVSSAVENVRGAVKAGDVDVSLKVLRLVGARSVLETNRGPTTVEDVEIQQAAELSSRSLNRLMAGL